MRLTYIAFVLPLSASFALAAPTRLSGRFVPEYDAEGNVIPPPQIGTASDGTPIYLDQRDVERLLEPFPEIDPIKTDKYDDTLTYRAISSAKAREDDTSASKGPIHKALEHAKEKAPPITPLRVLPNPSSRNLGLQQEDGVSDEGFVEPQESDPGYNDPEIAW